MVETDIEAVQAHLDERPDDWTARLALADLLEETDPRLARAMRWMGERRKCPTRHHATATWDWWVIDVERREQPESAILPAELAEGQPIPPRRYTNLCYEYKSRRSAEDGLAAALAATQPD